VMANLVGAQNVFDACLASGCDQVVMASTSSVYGNTTVIPFVETDAAVQPRQPYAASKRSAEILAYTYSQVYGLRVTVTRFFTVYGPRGRPDMMPLKLAQSITTGEEVPLFDGDFKRDWTYISDICDGIAAATRKPMEYEIVNLGRGGPESLADFIAEMERVAGKRANLKASRRPASEMLTTWADISKARDLLGYEPKVSIRDGVQYTWDWFNGQDNHA
jgi:UDP-glucuronate 4-epimerase